MTKANSIMPVDFFAVDTGLTRPNGRTPSDDWTRADSVSVTRRLGGLLHEYEPAA